MVVPRCRGRDKISLQRDKGKPAGKTLDIGDGEKGQR